MTVPVFVLGRHRSGTTWLANQLCRHSRVAGVQHDRHHGIHESVYFSRLYGRYGDLSVRTNFVEFVQVAAASDYFRLAGASRDFLYSCWPTDYPGLFRRVMDAFATRRGATHWIEKSPSHTVLVHWLAELYPDARFVAVRRSLEGVLDSGLALQAARRPGLGGRERRALVLRTAAGWSYYDRVLRDFARRSPRLCVVEYEALRSDLAGSLERICGFLDLELEARMLEPGYAPNTSFPAGSRGGARSDPGERRLARWAAGVAGRVPLGALRRVLRARHRPPRRPGLPPWFFSLLDTGNPALDGGIPAEAPAAVEPEGRRTTPPALAS